jgi:flagellar hook-associated protein 1
MSLLSIGVSGLMTNQLALDTTGHNISNVNTEGYSRQRVNFSATDPFNSSIGYVGTGVTTHDIHRQYDDFIAGQVRASTAVAAELQSYYTAASRLDNLVADQDAGLQPAIQNFFDAMQGLANDPTSISARQLLLSEAESMVDRFNYFDRQFEDSRNQVNSQLLYNITKINRLADNIAEVNSNIQLAYGDNPNDLLDQREQLLSELSELVDIQVVEQSDGSANVFIGKGQPLVVGVNANTMSVRPSPLDTTHLEITFDYSFGSQVVTDQISGGAIGGLLKFREEMLDPVQNQVGLIALGIADEINTQHQLGLDLDGVVGGAMFSLGSVQVLPSPGSGTLVTATYSDIGELTVDDYSLTYDGVDFILKNQTTGATQALAAGLNTVDGMTIDIDATGAIVGDSFMIQPTRSATRGIDLLINDVSRLAAAGPLQVQPAVDANGNSLNSGDALVTQPSNSSMTGLPLVGGDIQLVYDDNGGPTSGFEVYYPGSTPGVDPFDDFISYDNLNAATVTGIDVPPATFTTLGGIGFSISGIPADGDAFIISNNANGSSDNRNALSLENLQNQSLLLSGSATFDEAYVQMVSEVGANTHHAELNLSAQESLLATAQEALSSVSGVNLDEEAAKLIQYQKSYEASAQVISVANTLFDTLLGAVRS